MYFSRFRWAQNLYKSIFWRSDDAMFQCFVKVIVVSAKRQQQRRQRQLFREITKSTPRNFSSKNLGRPRHGVKWTEKIARACVFICVCCCVCVLVREIFRPKEEERDRNILRRTNHDRSYTATAPDFSFGATTL
jgi:hypothetical protein